jgi:hypothetical protein
MGVASVMSIVALGGIGFMLRFLIALLREGAFSVWYWITPRGCEARKEFLQVVSVVHDVIEPQETEHTSIECRTEILENQKSRDQGVRFRVHHSPGPHYF